ncbi:MAG: acetyl-CoA carboxylase, biotin carboxyl carrier protein [Frankiales bacterium]|nr:acetyl-CoA carboxylase, biotin carboxyl carrier protein [Frankiales bacterium]
MPLNPPDAKELKDIVDWVNLTADVRELSIKFGDVELFISRDRQRPAGQAAAAPAPVAAAPAAAAQAAAPAAPAAPAPVAPAAAAPASPDALAPDEVLIKAPMVGTFYASPKPGSPAFVAVGDTVSAETVLCIVEVMKLMNNVEAQVDGTVTRILVNDNQAVEYGQPLMVIKRAA